MTARGAAPRAIASLTLAIAAAGCVPAVADSPPAPKVAAPAAAAPSALTAPPVPKPLPGPADFS